MRLIQVLQDFFMSVIWLQLLPPHVACRSQQQDQLTQKIRGVCPPRTPPPRNLLAGGWRGVWGRGWGGPGLQQSKNRCKRKMPSRYPRSETENGPVRQFFVGDAEVLGCGSFPLLICVCITHESAHGKFSSAHENLQA